jgi:phosphohistidine swiveling domain-containing protein
MIARLGPRRSQTLCREERNPALLARQIHYLLNDCETLGLVPFSVLARYAFIAVALVQSLGQVGLFTDEECEAIFRSIPTIATQMSKDLARLGSGQMTKAEFLQLYGHLRPSSYDITSPSYAFAPELYLTGQGFSTKGSVEAGPSLLDELFESRQGAIDQLLTKLGFQARTKHLREFVRRAIPGREWAKFEFMKNTNAALELTAAFGEQLGISHEEMSFLPVERILHGVTDSATAAMEAQLEREIGFAMKRWQLTCSIRLPHLVTSSKDVDSFHVEEWSPNFVSRQRVIAPPVILDDMSGTDGLDGKIVLVRAADPGYDWIFGHAIAGLVTQYGGVASHMAIRAAEFGLPAAIGCGELIFERLRHSRLLELDCANKRINPVQ